VIALYSNFNINFTRIASLLSLRSASFVPLASLRSLLSLRSASFVPLASLRSVIAGVYVGRSLRLLIANCANDSRDGLKSRNKGGDSGEHTLNHRQHLLCQPALLVGTGGGGTKIRISREIHRVKACYTIIRYNIFYEMLFIS
jgi:hypothetical protein